MQGSSFFKLEESTFSFIRSGPQQQQKNGLGLTGTGWPEKQKIFFHLGQLGPAWAVLVWGGPVPVICLSLASPGQPGPRPAQAGRFFARDVSLL